MAASPKNADEQKYYGLNACKAVWKSRGSAIIRVYVTEARLRDLRGLLRWCAKNKRAYHIVSGSEIEKICGSKHHEGVTLLAKKREPELLSSKHLNYFSDLAAACLLYLDGVQNPHNVGAVLRTAAHFGVQALFAEKEKFPSISGALSRVSEGGVEMVPIYLVGSGKEMLGSFKKTGFKILATSSHAKKSCHDYNFPAKTVMVFGAEEKGISKEVEKLADAVLSIPGSGAVESLNVSSATAILLAEYARQNNEIKRLSRPRKSG